MRKVGSRDNSPKVKKGRKVGRRRTAYRRPRWEVRITHQRSRWEGRWEVGKLLTKGQGRKAGGK